MNRKTPVNLPASVADRLRAIARREGEQLQNVLNRYALERWLYRSSQSPYAERFILKGALLFTLWSEEPHRRTRDLDLLGRGGSKVAEWEAVFREICGVAVAPDGLQMLAESVRGEEIRVEEEYAGVRIRLLALLGKARIPLQIDVGFGDAVTPEPQAIRYPTLLDFPAPALRAYRPKTVIAEKFQALVDKGLKNTRLKDYYDIWKLAQQFEFDGATLGAALRATFARRQTPLPVGVPLALSDQFVNDRLTQWRSFLRKNALRDHEVELAEVVAVIIRFLLPLAQALRAEESCVWRWSAKGQWELNV